MRIPTFSRETDTDTDTLATDTADTTTATTPVRARRDEDTTADLRPRPVVDSNLPPAPATASTPVVRKDLPSVRRTEADRAAVVDSTGTVEQPVVTEPVVTEPVVAGPRPRASMLATLSLIFGVAAALLVLSGPLLGWGIGVAGLALVLSLGGIHATGKRHVAGKVDALIGMVLALGAIVVGVFALTGSLSWLGTNTHNVESFRQWLDTQFANRF